MKTTQEDQRTKGSNDQGTEQTEDQGILQSRDTEAVPTAERASGGGVPRSRGARSVLAGKPRCDSTLDRLAPERRERLAGWLLDENKGYVEVRELVAREWGVRTSRSAVGRYFRGTLAAGRLASSDKWRVTSDETRQDEEADAREAAEAMGPPSPRLRRGDDVFGEAALRRAQQLGFMALMEPKPDLKAARVFLGMVDTIERRELARERIALRERLVKLRELKETPPEPPRLTYEEKVARECAIFGVEPEFYHEQVRRQEEAVQARNAEGGTGNGQTRSEERGTREEAAAGDGTAAGCRSHGNFEEAGVGAAGDGQGEDSRAITSTITIKSTSGGAGEGPGVPGSFRVGLADPAVFSSGGEVANERGSVQPQIAPMPQMEPVLPSREGSAGVEAGATAGGDHALLQTDAAGAITSKIASTSTSGKAEGAPEGRSGEAALRGTGGTGEGIADPPSLKLRRAGAEVGVGTAAGCRSHGCFGPAEVSFGRVWRAEDTLRALSAPAAQASPGAAGFRSAVQQNTLQRMEEVRGVADGPAGGRAVYAAERPIWPRPEAIFQGEGTWK